jgi:hypothetical protein
VNRALEAAYAMLGLRPGADRETVERAYRRLIKEHHPDRLGGNGERASEINRAYTLIRKTPAYPPPVPIPQRTGRAERRGGGVFAFLIVGLVAVTSLIVFTAGGTGESPWASLQASIERGGETVVTSGPPRPGLEEPIATSLIDLAVADAVRLHESAETRSMAANSAECLRALRAEPSAARFDSCAAFDEAVSILETGRAGFQRGPFNAAAVSARQVAAGRLFSTDTFAVDSRLQQIRSRVQLALFPTIPDPPAADLNSL